MKKIGFSLVELSIVLVIIGIIIGGIMVGKSMTDSAKRTAIISDWQKYSAAVNSYYSKYSYFPGDDAEAASTATGGKWATATSGDGNGLLCTGTSSCQTSQEYMYFWQDLLLANFLNSGTYSGAWGSVPGTAIANTYMTHYYDGTNTTTQAQQAFYVTGTKPTSNVGYSSETPTYSMSPNAALAIDTKIDDATYNSGNVRAVGCTSYAASTTVSCNLYYIYKK